MEKELNISNNAKEIDANQSQLTVIATFDTLIGVDCLELAYRSSTHGYRYKQGDSEKPRYNIQLLGIKGGWDSNLDSSALYHMNEQWLRELGKEKISGTATYQNWMKLEGEKVNLQDIASRTIVLCLPIGNMTATLIKQTGKSIIELAKEASTPLEELAHWLNEPLLPIEEAHATYCRDYLPGLSFQGINYKTSDDQIDGYCAPSVEKILNRVKSFQQTELDGACELIKTDACWRGLPFDELQVEDENTRQEVKQKYKEDKEVCFYLVDERELKQHSNHSNYELYKELFLETLDQEFCEALYQDAAKDHQSLFMPTSLVLYSTDSQKQTDSKQNLSEQLNQVERIEFATSKSEKESLLTLAALPELKGLVDVRVISGQFSHYFRADIIKKSNADSKTVVDLIVNHLLGICLDKERPLVSYGATFFLPFRLAPENKGSTLISENECFTYQNIINAKKENVETHKERSENDTLSPDEGERFNLIANERDAFLYLQPVIRERFFNLDKKTTQRILELRSNVSPDDEVLGKDDERLVWSLKIEEKSEKKKKEIIIDIDRIEATVRSIKLHKFYNDVYILSVNVYERFFQGPQDSTSFTSGENNWWHDLYSKDKETQKTIESAQIKHWLTYTDKIRQLYPSFANRKIDDKTLTSFYFGKAKDRNIESSERKLDFKALTEHSYALPNDFCEIFKQVGITEPQKLKFRPFIDNRLFVNTTYGLAGNLHINESARNKYDALYSLAAYVDGPNQAWSSLGGYVYDPKFTQALLEEHTYQRWEAMGNKYAFTNYSNVYMGYGGEFNNKIAPCHVFYNYQYMLLLALFYRESLHDFSERISEISKNINTAPHKEFEKIHQDFIRFTNVSWFEDLSSQIQGKEIYNKIIHGLDIKKEYEFLEKEISATYQHFQESTTHQFTFLAFLVTVAALCGSAYSIYSDNRELDDQMTITPWGLPLLFALFLVAILIQNPLLRWAQNLPQRVKNPLSRLWRRIKFWLKKVISIKSIYWVGIICLLVWVAQFTQIFSWMRQVLD